MKLNIKYTLLNILMIILSIFIYLYSDLLHIKYIAYIYFIIIYVSILIRVISDKVDIVDIFIAYLLLYPLFGIIVFTEEKFAYMLSDFINKNLIYNKYYVFKYVFVTLIGIIPFSYIPSIRLNKKTAKENNNYLKFDLIGKITELGLIFFILFLIYLYYKTGGKYIWFTEISNKSQLFSLLAWLGIIFSSLITLSYVGHGFHEKKFFIIIITIVIILFFILKIRMYSALFIFSLLLNLYIRNLKITKRIVFYLFIILMILLFGNIFRFENVDFSNTKQLIFSVLGEFIMPNISAYYLICDPLEYSNVLNIKDLIFQLLPSAIRPYPALYEFRDFYLSKGIDPWPIGGLYFQGQLFFYFNFLYIFIMWLLSLYLIKVKQYIYNKTYSSNLVYFPIFSMVLPRMELWVLRSILFSIFFYIVARELYIIIRPFKK